MPIYNGNTKQKDLYYGNVKIKEAYYGSTKVYSSLNQYQYDVSDYEYTLQNNILTLTKYIGNNTNVVVPVGE